MNKQVLEELRNAGSAPRTMLDIGAHIGTFTHEFLSVFPSCVPTLIEPKRSVRPASPNSLRHVAPAVQGYRARQRIGAMQETRPPEPRA